MKKLTMISTFMLFAVPFVVFGADTGGLVPCSGTECQACDLLTLIQRILNFLVQLATWIAIMTLAWTGVEMMYQAADPIKHSALRKRLKNIIIGFLLMLGAWTIVDTGMKLLLNDQVYGGWNTIQCSAN